MKKYGLGKALEQLSDARSKGSGVRQERADEKRQILERLAKSGEPFWIMAKKGEITAKIGQPLFRIYRKKALGHFPTIQECHGKSVALKELLYEKILFGNNEVVKYTYRAIEYHKGGSFKGYSLRVPFGMLSHSGNGNVVLAWYQKS